MNYQTLSQHYGRGQCSYPYDSEEAKIWSVPRWYYSACQKLFRRRIKTWPSDYREKIVECTAYATWVSTSIVCKIKTKKDAENWKFKSGESIQVTQKSEVPENFCIIIWQIIRDGFLSKKKIPTVDRAHEKIFELKVEHILHLNLFQASDIPASDSMVWVL